MYRRYQIVRCRRCSWSTTVDDEKTAEVTLRQHMKRVHRAYPKPAVCRRVRA